MRKQISGMVYYCILPEQASWDEKTLSIQMLKQIFLEFFEMELDEKQILQGSHGKPYYAGHKQIQFNISHCKRAVAVAVANIPLGIDVEVMRRVNYRTVKKCCNQKELTYVLGETDKEREGSSFLSEAETIRFLELWTLKESYVKMTGEGLRTPLRTVNFKLQDEKSPKGIDDSNQYCLYQKNGVTIALTVQGKDVSAESFVWREYSYEEEKEHECKREG